MRHLPRHTNPSVVFALVAGLGLFSTVAVADDRAPIEIHAHALDRQPESRIEAGQAMDGAVAASVIGAIASQFGERKVVVMLDEVAVHPASVRDRTVSGQGRLQIGGDANWIPFRFDVLYDTRTASVSHPAVTLGHTDLARDVALDSPLALELGLRADEALDAEFIQQPVRLVMSRVTATDTGTRYMLVQAVGTADFAMEGTTPTRVQALYDRKTGEWLRLDYELGTTSNRAEPDDVVAIR